MGRIRPGLTLMKNHKAAFPFKAKRSAGKSKIDNGSPKQRMIVQLIAGFIFSGLAICYFVIPSFREAMQDAFSALLNNDRETVQGWVEKLGVTGPVVLILAFSVQMFLFVVPNPLLMVVAILSYGPVWGSLIALAGVFCASSLGFVVGKSVGLVTIHTFISAKRIDSWTAFVNRYGLIVIFYYTTFILIR
jgi:uncharacterized membrane protein YdjX (TVP38/TMEM64 family)